MRGSALAVLHEISVDKFGKAFLTSSSKDEQGLSATMRLAPFGLHRKTRSMNPKIENYMYTCLHNQMFGWMSLQDRM